MTSAFNAYLLLDTDILMLKAIRRSFAANVYVFWYISIRKILIQGHMIHLWPLYILYCVRCELYQTTRNLFLSFDILMSIHSIPVVYGCGRQLCSIYCYKPKALGTVVYIYMKSFVMSMSDRNFSASRWLILVLSAFC